MKSSSIGILSLLSCVSSYCVTSERPQTPFPTQVNRIGTESTCAESTCLPHYCSPKFRLIKEHMNRPMYQFQSPEQQLFTAIDSADIAKIRVILASHT